MKPNRLMFHYQACNMTRHARSIQSLFYLGLAGLLLLFAAPSFSAEVTNLVPKQEGNNIIFNFDVTGEAGETETEVMVVISAAGKELRDSQLHLQGDHGKVNIGKGKRISWDVIKDFPNGLAGDVSWGITAKRNAAATGTAATAAPSEEELRAASSSETVTLRFSTFFPPRHKLAIVTQEWCNEVEKRTNGKVKVRHYAGAVLSPPNRTYDNVAQGVVDAGNIVLGYTVGKFPLSEVLDYPLGYRSGTAATRLANAYYARFSPKELDDVKIMYLHAQAPGILHTSRRPVAGIDDLRGMKIRSYGVNARFVSLLGGTPIAMPMGDAYEAISRGVADGILCGNEALEGWKIGETVKYTTENYGSAYTAVFVVAMNKSAWGRIHPAFQAIIGQINQEWIERTGQVWDALDDSGRVFSARRGNQTIRLSAEEDARWAAKAQPLIDSYVAKTKAMGLPGDEVVTFCQEWLRRYPR
jgi:TRAP-type transport system periplasmic protein